MISELKIQNFKGACAQYKFGVGNAIFGRNMTGKTTIREAISACVLGYVKLDGIPKTISGLKEFASGCPMSLSMTADEVEFGITFDKVKSTFKPTREDTVASIEGGLSDQMRVLFDPDIFFGLTDAARISKACELVQSVGGGRNELVDTVGEIVRPAGSPGVSGGDGVETPLGKMFLDWSKGMTQDKTINDLLAESEIFWKEQKKQINAEKDRMQKTVEGTADLAAMEAELSQLPQQHVADARHKEAQLAHQAARDAYNAALRVNNDHTTRKVETDVDRALADKFDERTAVVAKIEAELTDISWRIEQVTARGMKAKSDLETVMKDKPTAATVRVETPWKDGEPVAGSLAYDTEIMIEGRAVLTQNGYDVRAITRWKKIVAPVAAEEVERLAQAEYDYAQRIEEAQATKDEIACEYTALAGLKTSIVCREKMARQSLSDSVAAKARQEQGRVALPPWNGTEQLDALVAECSRTDALMGAAFDVSIKVAKMAQDQKRVKDAAEKRTVVEGHLKIVGRVIELLVQKKQELVSGSIEEPLELANKLGDGILRGKLVFQEGQIGMLVDGKVWGQRTFSGTENIITVMGLTAGLAKQSALRVLILDEVGRLDTGYALELVDNLAGMVIDGDIDQWFIFGPDNTALAESPVFANGEAEIIQLGAVLA